MSVRKTNKTTKPAEVASTNGNVYLPTVGKSLDWCEPLMSDATKFRKHGIEETGDAPAKKKGKSKSLGRSCSRRFYIFTHMGQLCSNRHEVDC